jgi:methyl-accepting chemotaxis protein
MVAVVAISAALASIGCGGPGKVRFDRERCYIDGRAAALPEVEERETAVEHRIAARQPWLVVITVAVVLLAGAGYIEKLLLLLSASRDTKGMGERLRELVERYRAHRLRYVGLVGGSVGLLVTAAILYIYLDADKRSSERALAALQFCHLALRTGDQSSALDEQRRNLASIHQTAGEIRRLIDQLPPAERVKAQQIMVHVRDGTLSIERDLSGLESAVGGLQELPASVKGLADTAHRAEQQGSALDGKVTDVAARLQAVQRTLDGLASRPQPSCPACVCHDEEDAAAKPAATSANP